MKPEIDLSRWPVLVVLWPSELTLDEADAHFDEIRMYAVKGSVIGIVVDMTASGMPPAAHRRHAAVRLREIFLELGDRIAGVAHVITSPLVRGLLAGIYWLSPPPFATIVVKSQDEAIAWTRRCVEVRTGIQQPQH